MTREDLESEFLVPNLRRHFTIWEILQALDFIPKLATNHCIYPHRLLRIFSPLDVWGKKNENTCLIKTKLLLKTTIAFNMYLVILCKACGKIGFSHQRCC